MVRAKFVVQEIVRRKHWDSTKGEIHTVILSPVVAGSEENQSFFASTPAGQIELGSVGDKAASAFALGGSYFVDFTAAE